MTTKTTREPKPELYILLTERREHGYYHLTGRVVTPRYEQGSQQPYSPDDQYSNGPLYSGLQTRCQGDDSSRHRMVAGDAQAVYGFDTLYHDVYSVSRRDAVRMAKTLTTLEAKLDKLTEARGYHQTYGEYVGRVAEALGCTGIAFERERKSREMSGERWQWDSIGHGVYTINKRIAAWVDEARPALPTGNDECPQCSRVGEGPLCKAHRPADVDEAPIAS